MGILVLAATVFLLSLLASSASQEVNTTFPIKYRARAAEGGEQACSHDELRQRLQDITRSDVSNLLKNSLPALVQCSNTNLGQLEHCPAISCRDIDGTNPFYVPLVTTGSGPPTDLQCGSIAAWIGVVAATTMDGGPVLPTST